MFLQYGSKSSSSECVSTIATQVGMTMDHNEKMFCSALAFQEPPTCKTVTMCAGPAESHGIKNQQQKGESQLQRGASTLQMFNFCASSKQ